MAMNEEDFAQAEEDYKEDPDVQAAEIGIALQRVMGQKAGKHLLYLAQTQIDDGIEKLLELDMEDDMKNYRKVKTDILVARQALTWIVGSIEEGENAAEKLHQEDADRLEGYN